MPIYIKTGYWEKRKTGYNYALDLDNVISNDPTVKQTSLIIYPLGYSYPDYSTMTGDSVNQTINNYQYVTNIDSYYQFLGSTSYKKLTPEEQALLVHYNEGRKPVHKIYTDATAMYADQKKQHYGWLYRIETDDSHWEYLGTTLGTIADYKPVGGSGGATPDLQAVTDVGYITTNPIHWSSPDTNTITGILTENSGLMSIGDINSHDATVKVLGWSGNSYIELADTAVNILATGFSSSYITLNSDFVQLTGWGSGTKTGTPTYSLAVDSAGNIIETTYSSNTGDQTLANTSDATTHTVTLSGSGGSVQLVEGTGITLATTGTASDGIVTITSTATGGGSLEAIDEGNGVGWRLKERDAANYGPIGLKSIDLSYSSTVSSLKGAMGSGDIFLGNAPTYSLDPNADPSQTSQSNFIFTSSFLNGTTTNNLNWTSGEGYIKSNVIFGYSNTINVPGSGAIVSGSFISGDANTITGYFATGRYYNTIFGGSNTINQSSFNFIQGSNNTISGTGSNAVYSSIFGYTNATYGAYSFTTGQNNINRGSGEVVIGQYSLDVASGANCAFRIGNGTGTGARKDALQVYKEWICFIKWTNW